MAEAYGVVRSLSLAMHSGRAMVLPLLQLKVGFYLSDMREPSQGNLTVVPGSHKALEEPDPADLKSPELFPGAVQPCGDARP